VQLMARSIGGKPTAAKYFFRYSVEFMRFYTIFFKLYRKRADTEQENTAYGQQQDDSDRLNKQTAA